MKEEAAATLAACRKAGTLCRLPLNEFKSRTDAETFQAAAVAALAGRTCGYKIGATSAQVQQLLKCPEPIFAPIMREHVIPSGASFEIPAGLLGVECEFG